MLKYNPHNLRNCIIVKLKIGSNWGANYKTPSQLSPCVRFPLPQVATLPTTARVLLAGCFLLLIIGSRSGQPSDLKKWVGFFSIADFTFLGNFPFLLLYSSKLVSKSRYPRCFFRYMYKKFQSEFYFCHAALILFLLSSSFFRGRVEDVQISAS